VISQVCFIFLKIRKVVKKWIIEKYDGAVWTGFVWLRIGTRGVLL
jgi:hypothetical protein